VEGVEYYPQYHAHQEQEAEPHHRPLPPIANFMRKSDINLDEFILFYCKLFLDALKG
jgi:hypothetical protein